MKTIKYIRGNVLEPIGEGNKIIIHCCNDLKVMGSGVALALRNKWPVVFDKYKNSSAELGTVSFAKVDDGVVVANIIGQHGVGFTNSAPPVRYEAIDSGLKKVMETAKRYNASVHSPYNFGCVLAGGKWSIVEEIINRQLSSNDIEVIIYDIHGVREKSDKSDKSVDFS